MKIKNIYQPIWETPDFNPETFLYQYRAIRKRLVDGDSVYAFVDQGMGDWRLGKRKNGEFEGVSIRFARIDAYETRGIERPQGLTAKDFVDELLPFDTEFRIYTYKDNSGMYGRLLADLRLPDGRCLNDLVVSEGHGTYEDY